MKMTWRRFVLLDKEKEQALLQLIKQKDLSREDLMLILQTIRVNENYTIGETKGGFQT